MEGYDSEFFDRLDESAHRSARAIIPLIRDFLDPGSVVDVGCGRGGWLAAFAQVGIDDILGIDGAYVDTAELAIPADRFLSHDLREPLTLHRSFDLVLSLEVAEHLPGEHAEVFIESLTGLGPAVLFSAAIPGQGGRNHVNEQWADYWAERFARHGYVPVDCIRGRVWRNDAVAWWYAQNTVFYVKEGTPEARRLTRRAGSPAPSWPARRVHPRNLGTRWAVADWTRERLRIADALEESTPPDAVLAVPEASRWGLEIPAREIVPLWRRRGIDQGAPDDDEGAWAELERSRSAGATHLAFPWPTFWWLDHYALFLERVRDAFPCVRDDRTALVFSLAPPRPAP